jgi:hypothetical protein
MKTTNQQWLDKIFSASDRESVIKEIKRESSESALREAAEVKVSFPSYVESPHEAELFEAGRQAFENEVRALITKPK